MISIRSTENMTGVTIRGDFDDFYSLVEAFHEITIDEYSEKFQRCYDMSIRLLGICYDIRHAYMGYRDVVLVDNSFDEELMNYHSIVEPIQNVYYECNCLYPEMIFALMAINELIDVRTMILTKKNYLSYNAHIDKKVIWDKTIAVMRGFQSAFAKCVQEMLTPNLFSRWLSSVTQPYISISNMAGQYLDVVNIDYINMTREKRLKNFTAITRRIAVFYHDEEYCEIKEKVSQAAREYGCAESDLKLYGIDYPEEIEW